MEIDSVDGDAIDSCEMRDGVAWVHQHGVMLTWISVRSSKDRANPMSTLSRQLLASRVSDWNLDSGRLLPDKTQALTQIHGLALVQFNDADASILRESTVEEKLM